MQEKIEVKEHAENMVKAIQALMPSRNYIVQFLSMAHKMDLPTVHNAFPVLIDEERNKKALELAFGVSFGEQVEVSQKLGSALIEFYSRIFNVLDDKDVKQGLAHLIETDIVDIPNPKREWLEMRLRSLAIEPTYGKEAVNVLQAIKKIGEEKKENPKYEATKDKIAKIAGIEDKRLYYVVELLLKYKLLNKVSIEVDEQGKKIKKDGIQFADSLKGHVDVIDIVFK